jgi:hypothetical protein
MRDAQFSLEIRHGRIATGKKQKSAAAEAAATFIRSIR